MAAGFAFFGAKGGAKAVNFAKGVDVGLVVKLAGLGQVNGVAKVIDLKEGTGSLSGGGGEDGRARLDKIVAVQPIAPGRPVVGPLTKQIPLQSPAKPVLAI